MTSTLEVAANIVLAASILLAGRNSVHTWWTGIVGCALFLVLFAQAQLYADALLQVFFIATSAWGWRQWVKGRGPAHKTPFAPSLSKGASARLEASPTLPVTRTPVAVLMWSVLGGIAAAFAYGALLHAFTDAYAPFADSAVLSCSVIAQLLLMQRRVENWPLWLLANSIAVPLFASRGLHLTAVLYAAYWVNALIAWRHWHGLAAKAPRSTADRETAA